MEPSAPHKAPPHHNRCHMGALSIPRDGSSSSPAPQTSGSVIPANLSPPGVSPQCWEQGCSWQGAGRWPHDWRVGACPAAGCSPPPRSSLWARNKEQVIFLPATLRFQTGIFFSTSELSLSTASSSRARSWIGKRAN